MLPLLSAFRFGQGLLLQEVAAWVQAHGVRALPPPLSLPLHLACEAARLAAVAMQVQWFGRAGGAGLWRAGI